MFPNKMVYIITKTLGGINEIDLSDILDFHNIFFQNWDSWKYFN